MAPSTSPGIFPSLASNSIEPHLDNLTVSHHLTLVIRSFRSKALRRFSEEGDASKLSVQHTDRLRRQLARLDASTLPEDMNLPGYRFHALKGGMAGRFAVNVSGNWRLTFAWLEGDAVDVDLEDYH